MGVTMKKSRALKVLSAVLVAGFALAGCSSADADSGADSAASQGNWPRTVETPKGPVEITSKPERIVSTSVTLTGTLLSIDAPVVATASTGPNTDVSDAQGLFTQWGDIARERGLAVLPMGGANAESVLAQNPDLIVVSATGGDSVVDLYEQFTAIAPTIVVDYGGSSWQEVAAVLGEATGLEDNAAATVAKFDSAVEAAKAKITLPPQPTTALVYYEDGSGANIWTRESGQAKLLTAMGFTVADIPESAKSSESMGKRKDIIQVSAENLYDGIAGKTLILVSADDGAVKAVEALPLLAQHPAIRDHHVYAVGLDTFRLDYYSATNMVNRLVEQFG